MSIKSSTTSRKASNADFDEYDNERFEELENNNSYYVEPIIDNDSQEYESDFQESNNGNVIVESIFSNPDTPLSFIITPSLAIEIDDYAKPLLDSSLRPASTPIAQKGATASLRGDWEKPIKDKTGRLVDQPVTFHNRIKSSGYGQKPPDAFAKKRLEQANKQRARSNSVPRAIIGGGSSSSNAPPAQPNAKRSAVTSTTANIVKSGVRIRRYPVNCNPMTEHQPANNFPVDRNASSAPIYNIEYSGDASVLGVATTDATVLTVKLPVARNNGDAVSYMGHDGRINNVTFSHNRPHGQHMILSCSSDGTARLWKSGRIDSAAVIFSHTKHQPGDLIPNVGSLTVSAVNATNATVGGSGKSSRNRPYGDAITGAQFYYMDKFILLSVKSSLYMYSYVPEGSEAKNDLKRLLSTGKYKAVHEWDMSGSAQNICAMACLNSVESRIIVAATSDKKLNVFDAAVGGVIRQIESPHDKNIHCIALPRPSVHVSVEGSEAYNTFLTSATDSVIALWDVRAPTCVARYSTHVNKREAISCCLSPCLRYIATGSEDRSARILDVRTGQELAKLNGHRDVVSSVAFNPLFSQLATASYDGQIRFHIDPTLYKGEHSRVV